MQQVAIRHSTKSLQCQTILGLMKIVLLHLLSLLLSLLLRLLRLQLQLIKLMLLPLL